MMMKTSYLGSSVRRLQGYTLIEVMMALAVMTVGALGIFALQGSTVRGNIEARQMTTASAVARTWMERLKRDGLQWTTPNNLLPTTYLNVVPADYFRPAPPVGVNESYGFDYQGFDTGGNTGRDAPIVYCTQVRLAWVIPNQAMRADVMVYWPRSGAGAIAGGAYENCQGANAAIRADNSMRKVFVSTVLRWIPS